MRVRPTGTGPRFPQRPPVSDRCHSGNEPSESRNHARELGIVEAFGDWRLMLDHRRIDAAVIATPPGAQAEIVATALAIGLPVFAEKPLALALDQAVSLAAATGPLANVIEVKGARIWGISAPSRASTLMSYVGIDDGTIDYVAEIKGSLKIGKYMPGTLVPVVEEARIFEDQPEYALIFSWHIAEELIPKLRNQGYRGRFIVPLPIPHLV